MHHLGVLVKVLALASRRYLVYADTTVRVCVGRVLTPTSFVVSFTWIHTHSCDKIDLLKYLSVVM